jgi:hypothetical protein
MSLIHIASRLLLAVSNPHGWQQFLDEKYDGGKALVNNPDPHGRKKQVSVNYALKTESYRHRLSEEYHKWYGENKEKAKTRGRPKKVNPESVAKPVEAPIETPKYGPHKELLGEYTVEGMLEQYKDKITQSADKLKDITKDSRHKLSVIFSLEQLKENQTAKLSYSDKTYDRVLSTMNTDAVPPENIFGYSVFSYTDVLKGPKPKSYYASYMDQVLSRWRGSSSNDVSMVLQNLLKGCGVKGSYNDQESTPDEYLVENIKTVQKEVSRAYAYQMAVFKHLGVTHIDLYRGVQIDGDHKSGDSVGMKTRPASSWSSNPEVATRFGTTIVKCRVPVERILMSPIIDFWLDGRSDTQGFGETEFVVMGTEDLDGCEVF